MYIKLDEERLKSGETLQIGVVESPDSEWMDRIAPFLGHKGEPWREHIHRALEAPLDSLETRFYVGTIDDRIAAQIMIVSARGAGILGHVFTRPDDRRKGACSAIMRRQMADMARIGVKMLALGTGFESAAYWIYHGFGFRSIGPGRGEMTWAASPGAEAEIFAPHPVRAVPLGWGDWPWLNLLGMLPVADDEPLPRSLILGLKDLGSLERPTIPFLIESEQDSRIQALGLRSGAGATVGYALLAADPRWFGGAYRLDLYVHPHFRGSEPILLDAIKWPNAPCAHFRSFDPDRPGASSAPLTSHRFKLRATLPQWLPVGEKRRDTQLWIR